MAWVGAVVVVASALAGGPAASGGGADRSVDPTMSGGCDAPKLAFHALQVMMLLLPSLVATLVFFWRLFTFLSIARGASLW